MHAVKWAIIVLMFLVLFLIFSQIGDSDLVWAVIGLWMLGQWSEMMDRPLSN